METVEIVTRESGRAEESRTLQSDTDEARWDRLRAFLAETEELLKDVPLKEVCESDPFIAKFKRMRILDERS